MRRDIKLILLTLVLLLLITGCDRNVYTPEPSQNNSNEPEFNYNDLIPVTGSYAITKQGVYTVANEKIYYLNDEDEWNLLCFDPACEHKSPA